MAARGAQDTDEARKKLELKRIGVGQGLVNVPFWEYWTSPEKVAIIDHIPNGWVMFNGDI